MRYKIILKPSVKKELDGLPKNAQKQLGLKIGLPNDDAKPPGAEKVEGHGDLWRLRWGRYRMIYREPDERAVIRILRVRHRKDVYRNL